MTDAKKRKSDGDELKPREFDCDAKRSGLAAIETIVDTFDIAEDEIAQLFSAAGRRRKRSRTCSSFSEEGNQSWKKLEKEHSIRRIGDIYVGE